MSMVPRCDGCGAELASTGYFSETLRPHHITGTSLPTNFAGPHRVPAGRFDWCDRCALIAFRAVQDTAKPAGRT